MGRVFSGQNIRNGTKKLVNMDLLPARIWRHKTLEVVPDPKTRGHARHEKDRVLEHFLRGGEHEA